MVNTMKLGLGITLLGSVSMFALGTAAANAQSTVSTVNVTNSNAFISVDQFNEPAGSLSEINVDGSVDNTFTGTLSESESDTTTNILNHEFTTNIIGNEAILSIVSNTNNDDIGVDLAGISASTGFPPPLPEAEVDDANLAIDSIQRNTDVAATGSTTTTIESTATASVSNSTTTATGNLQSSSGALNLIDSSVDATANESTATVGIATSQLNIDSNLTFETDSSVEVNVEGDVDDSMLSVTSNTQSAFGAGNLATNDIEGAVNQADILVDANQAATSADITTDRNGSASTAAAFAIANIQTQLRSSLDATAGGSGDGFSLSIAGNATGNDVESVGLTNDLNTATSRIRGNEAANSITLSLNTVDTVADNGINLVPAIGTTAAIVSVQDNVDVDATATTMAGTLAGVVTAIDGEASETQISTSLNTLSARSELSTATNTMTVDANKTVITADTEASEASASTASTETAFSISNAQVSNTNSTSTATMFDFGGTGDSASVTTSVGAQVLNSTVESNSNMVTATALGNETANQITLSLNGVDTTLPADPPVIADDGYVAGIANTQVSEADILAQGPADDAVAVTVGANLDSSQLSAWENTVETSATANTGANRIIVDEATNLTTTSATGESTLSSVTTAAGAVTADAAFAVASRQEASGMITASLVNNLGATTDGAAISATIEGDILDSEISADDNMLSATAIGNEITPSTNAVSITGGTNVATSAAVANEQVLDGATVRASVGAPGMPTAPSVGGVSVTASGDILRSMITADDNTAEGSVTGNTATNLIEVSASTLAQGSNATISDGNAVSTAVTATSDNSLTNQQSITTNTTLDTTVGSAFAVVQDPTTSVEDSVISASENMQTATTLGNEASNTIRLEAGEITSGAALVSNQSGADITVDASSTMDVYAPGANEDSMLSLNENENLAVATTNTVSNSVTATGEILSLDASGVGADVTSTASGTAPDTEADYVVSSLQSSAATVGAEATSRVVNGDGGTSTSFNTDGVLSSTVDMIDNETTAEAAANASGNSISLNGDGENMPATAALLNDQNASGTVEADAKNTVNLTIGTTTVNSVSPLSASTVTLSGNATTARATANSATNSMSLNALNLNNAAGSADVDGAAASGDPDVQASYALMNDQSNSAAVESLATATYTVTLDTAAASTTNPAINLSTVDMTGNSVLAQGNGNIAQNTASLTVGNTGAATAGVLNAQTNTAGISSEVVEASIGVYPTVNTDAAALSGSTVDVLGNTVGAFAAGNSATNAMNVSARDLTDASSGSSSLTGTALNVNASFASLNDQTNNGKIEANVTSASIGVYPTGSGTALNSSTVNVSGNSVRAQAVGNSATNTATMTALNYGSSSVGAGNSQTNTGDIIASVGGTSIGMDGSVSTGGAISSSSVTIRGSSINATAVGNSVVSTISRN